MPAPVRTNPIEELRTAARIVTELGMGAESDWQGYTEVLGGGPARTARGQWLHLMAPAIATSLAGMLRETARDIRAGIDSGVNAETMTRVYDDALSLARHIIDHAPAVPR